MNIKNKLQTPFLHSNYHDKGFRQVKESEYEIKENGDYVYKGKKRFIRFVGSADFKRFVVTDYNGAKLDMGF